MTISAYFIFHLPRLSISDVLNPDYVLRTLSMTISSQSTSVQTPQRTHQPANIPNTSTSTPQANAAPADSNAVPYAAAKSFMAGAISGAVAKTAVAPFDRTKILMQVSQMYGWKRYRGSVFESMRTIWQTEGFFGFFRGNSATIARIMPYAAVQYYTFEYYHRSLSEYVFHSDAPHPLKRFIAGAMAGSTSVLCTYPIDLARTVLAVQISSTDSAHAAKRRGVFSALYGIVQEQGVPAIYRGVYPTLVGVIPYAGISFLSFGVLKRFAQQRNIGEGWPIFMNLVCGASAGLSKSLLHSCSGYFLRSFNIYLYIRLLRSASGLTVLLSS